MSQERRDRLTENDRQHYLELKAAFFERSRRGRPDSELVYQAAQHLQIIEDRGYYAFEDVKDMRAWEKKCQVRQARKYRRIRRELTAKEVRGRRVGVETLDQVCAFSKGKLRDEALSLADVEELSAAALAKGRQAAERLWEEGRIEEALRALRDRSLAAAAAEEKTKKEKKAAEPQSEGAKRVAGLVREAAKLRRTLEAQEPEVTAVEARDLIKVTAELWSWQGSLAEIAAADAEQAVAAEAPPPRVTRPSSTAAASEKQDVDQQLTDMDETAKRAAAGDPGPAPEAFVAWLKWQTYQNRCRLEQALFLAAEGAGLGSLRALLAGGRNVPPEAWAWAKTLAKEAPPDAVVRALRLALAAQLPSAELRLRLLAKQMPAIRAAIEAS